MIALLGLPCGQVAETKRLGDNDHIALFQDGNRDRVFLDAAGQVARFAIDLFLEIALYLRRANTLIDGA